MLKELSRSDWLSLLAISEEMIPHLLLLRGTRNLKTNYLKHKKYFTHILEIESPNSIFEDILIGKHNETVCAYASVYGDAMASEITHLFGVLGTSLVIQTGCCGGLKENVLPGDLVCATSAYCGEGASRYYTSKKVVESSLVNWVEEPFIHKGPIWTTSALLAEGKEDIEKWHKKGYLAVDMETATTFSVAEYFGMDRLSLLFVFDNPFLGDHLVLTDTEKEERRNCGEKAMIDVAFSIAEKYCTSP